MLFLIKMCNTTWLNFQSSAHLAIGAAFQKDVNWIDNISLVGQNRNNFFQFRARTHFMIKPKLTQLYFSLSQFISHGSNFFHYNIKKKSSLSDFFFVSQATFCHAMIQRRLKNNKMVSNQKQKVKLSNKSNFVDLSKRLSWFNNINFFTFKLV